MNEKNSEPELFGITLKQYKRRYLFRKYENSVLALTVMSSSPDDDRFPDDKIESMPLFERAETLAFFYEKYAAPGGKSKVMGKYCREKIGTLRKLGLDKNEQKQMRDSYDFFYEAFESKKSKNPITLEEIKVGSIFLLVGFFILYIVFGLIGSFIEYGNSDNRLYDRNSPSIRELIE